MQNLNFIISDSIIFTAMRRKGITSVEELSKKLNVHRNTILPYLGGQRALPDCLDRLLKFLDLSPGEAIVKNVKSQKQYGLEIAPLVSRLIKQAPDNTYVLFGSRAKNTYKKYSDYDLGVYNTENLTLRELSKLIDYAKEWELDKPYDVNLTNLTLADTNFLEEIRNDWVFLGGNLESWIELQKKAKITLYE